jgi:hypothetical protein
MLAVPNTWVSGDFNSLAVAERLPMPTAGVSVKAIASPGRIDPSTLRDRTAQPRSQTESIEIFLDRLLHTMRSIGVNNS